MTKKSCLVCGHRAGQKKPFRYTAAGTAAKTPLVQGSFQNVSLALATHELLTKNLLNIRVDKMLCNCDPQRSSVTIFSNVTRVLFFTSGDCTLFSLPSSASTDAKAPISSAEREVLPREENVSQIHRHVHDQPWRAYQPSKRMCIRRPFLARSSTLDWYSNTAASQWIRISSIIIKQEWGWSLSGSLAFWARPLC